MHQQTCRGHNLMWFLIRLKTSWEQRTSKLAQLGLRHGFAQSAQRYGVQGETKRRAVAWSHSSLPPAFALRSERKNHSTRPMPDSANATSPGVLQLSYNSQCDTGTKIRYFSSPDLFCLQIQETWPLHGCCCLLSGHPCTGSSWCRQRW